MESVDKIEAEMRRDMVRRGFTRISDGPSRMGGLYAKFERDDSTLPGYVIVRLTDGMTYFIRRDEIATDI